MALVSYCGVPGSGKTLTATIMAKKHFKKENSKIKYFINWLFSLFPIERLKTNYQYYNNFPLKKINNIYSNYPILLYKNKKKNIEIYSNTINLWHMNNNFSFLPNAFIVIDEVQLYADSDEYKDKDVNFKLSKVAKFLQAHRHYGIKTIIFTSQNPSRIFKKARNICDSYLKLKKVVNLPFGISLVRGRGYYDLDYFGRYVPQDREERKRLPFEYYKFFKFFKRAKIYNSYDSRYLSEYNYKKPIYDKGNYKKLKVDYEYLKKWLEE
ncbi:MAG: zonular occludens toxin domain-containing protein [Bacilli bacterium]|nr:zonular occludens toxin domain-containing protein [Bacilli bacterium]